MITIAISGCFFIAALIMSFLSVKTKKCKNNTTAIMSISIALILLTFSIGFYGYTAQKEWFPPSLRGNSKDHQIEKLKKELEEARKNEQKECVRKVRLARILASWQFWWLHIGMRSEYPRKPDAVILNQYYDQYMEEYKYDVYKEFREYDLKKQNFKTP